MSHLKEPDGHGVSGDRHSRSRRNPVSCDSLQTRGPSPVICVSDSLLHLSRSLDDDPATCPEFFQNFQKRICGDGFFLAESRTTELPPSLLMPELHVMPPRSRFLVSMAPLESRSCPLCSDDLSLRFLFSVTAIWNTATVVLARMREKGHTGAATAGMSIK